MKSRALPDCSLLQALAGVVAVGFGGACTRAFAAPTAQKPSAEALSTNGGGKSMESGWHGGQPVVPAKGRLLKDETAANASVLQEKGTGALGVRAADLGAGVLPVQAPESEPSRGGAKSGGKADGEVQPLSIPLVPGYDSLGLTIPDHDESGRLRSVFVIGAVSRLDDRLVQIRETFLETYKEDGGKDLGIDLATATLDRFSRVLSTSDQVVIRREDFELKGAALEFNTVTRRGELSGPVEMTLYNFKKGPAAASEKETSSRRNAPEAKGASEAEAAPAGGGR